MPIWYNNMKTPADRAEATASVQIAQLQKMLQELQEQTADSKKQAKRTEKICVATLLVNFAALLVAVLIALFK